MPLQLSSQCNSSTLRRSHQVAERPFGHRACPEAASPDQGAQVMTLDSCQELMHFVVGKDVPRSVGVGCGGGGQRCTQEPRLRVVAGSGEVERDDAYTRAHGRGGAVMFLRKRPCIGKHRGDLVVGACPGRAQA
jgi:hypothetical protein